MGPDGGRNVHEREFDHVRGCRVQHCCRLLDYGVANSSVEEPAGYKREKASFNWHV